MAACYSELYEEGEVEISTCNWLDSNYLTASLNIRYILRMRRNTCSTPIKAFSPALFSSSDS